MLFSFDENDIATFTLYASIDGGTPREVPFTAGGQIAPIAYTDVSIGGVLIKEIVGSFNERVVDWSYNTELSMIAVQDTWNLEAYGSEYGVISIFAVDFDAADGSSVESAPFLYVASEDDVVSSLVEPTMTMTMMMSSTTTMLV